MKPDNLAATGDLRVLILDPKNSEKMKQWSRFSALMAALSRSDVCCSSLTTRHRSPGSLAQSCSLVRMIAAWLVKEKGKASTLISRHLQSWTAALYNLGSGSWLALTAVPRRRQWQPRARANGVLGPQLQPAFGLLCLFLLLRFTSKRAASTSSSACCACSRRRSWSIKSSLSPMITCT